MENDQPTNGQLEILRLLDGGLSRKLVSEKLGISISTVNTQLNLLYKIIGAHSILECLHKAREKGFLSWKGKSI